MKCVGAGDDGGFYFEMVLGEKVVERVAAGIWTVK